jgi:DivIVA domain-containing protein
MELPFKLVKFKTGYDIGQVGDFFSYSRKLWNDKAEMLTERDVRYARFDLMRKGYSIFEVDEALEHLEKQLAKRTKREITTAVGEDGWTELVTGNIKELYPILTAPKSEKFETEKTGEIAYDRKSVDKYLNIIYKQFFKGRKKLTARGVKSKSFLVVRPRRGYSTQKVDEFMDKVVEILNALEVELG